MKIIIKTAISGEFGSQSFELTKKEIELYHKIGPKINAALRKLNETGQLIAEVYGVCHENSAILFEDLKANEYCLYSQSRGFNFDEAKIVMKKVAEFHAITAVLQQEQPNIFENFTTGRCFSPKRFLIKFRFELLF